MVLTLGTSWVQPNNVNQGNWQPKRLGLWKHTSGSEQGITSQIYSHRVFVCLLTHPKVFSQNLLCSTSLGWSHTSCQGQLVRSVRYVTKTSFPKSHGRLPWRTTNCIHTISNHPVTFTTGFWKNPQYNYNGRHRFKDSKPEQFGGVARKHGLVNHPININYRIRKVNPQIRRHQPSNFHTNLNQPPKSTNCTTVPIKRTLKGQVTH